MIKVVINADNTDLSVLSNEVVHFCVQRGMTLGSIMDDCRFFLWESRFWDDPHFYRVHKDREKEFRTDPILVGVIEELGESCWHRDIKPVVIEIPFDGFDGWEIDSDGYMSGEWISEVHRTWEYKIP